MQNIFVVQKIKDQQFQLMQTEDNKVEQSKEYLQKLMKQTQSHKSVDVFTKNTEKVVQANIQEGSIKIQNSSESQSSEALTNHLLKKKEINPFDTRYKRFLLNTDRQKSQERLQVFKKIKQEYSKEKTAVVVKEVQRKIKQWASKKLEIQKKLQRSKQRKKGIEMELIQQMKRQQLEKKELEAFNKKQQLVKRLKMLEQKRQKREQLMKQTSIRTKEIKEPKFKEIQQKFNQIDQKIKQQQEKFLVEKRKSMIVSKEQILQHQKSYKKAKKQKQEERLKKSQIKVKNDQSLTMREQFDAFSLQHRMQHQQGLKKHKRRKQFAEKVKSMINLMKTSNNEENIQKLESQQIRRQKSSDEKDGQIKLKVRKRERSLNISADPRKLGNQYLKLLKEKDSQILMKSISLPKINAPSEASTSNKSLYKNYLTQIKVKRRQAKDEIQKLKATAKSKVEVLNELTRKSSEYEQNMIKKIKQLGRINKYNDSVQKQSQIDQLHARSIKMKLACLD